MLCDYLKNSARMYLIWINSYWNTYVGIWVGDEERPETSGELDEELHGWWRLVKRLLEETHEWSGLTPTRSYVNCNVHPVSMKKMLLCFMTT